MQGCHHHEHDGPGDVQRERAPEKRESEAYRRHRVPRPHSADEGRMRRAESGGGETHPARADLLQRVGGSGPQAAARVDDQPGDRQGRRRGLPAPHRTRDECERVRGSPRRDGLPVRDGHPRRGTEREVPCQRGAEGSAERGPRQRKARVPEGGSTSSC